MTFPLTRLDGDPRVAQWRDAVGAPLEVDAPAAHHPRGPSTHGTLLIVTWNLWIGRGRLHEVIPRARAACAAPGAPADGAPVVVLLQEAVRAGDAVPEASPQSTGVRHRPRRELPECDVADLARSLGYTLRYAPSMRNGAARSDRGCAILSSLPLEDAVAWELPFSYQRRVALAATVRLAGGRRVRVASAHLDNRGGRPRDILGVGGRGRQAEMLVQRLTARLPADVPVALGADLNLARGRREHTWRALAEAGFRNGLPERPPRWRHTFHRVPRLNLDWLLVRDVGSSLARVEVHRLDETPLDRGRYVFGSDHHPLAARIEVAPRAPEPA
ncbi:MAG TPA: endonuclease/exonuclease/phosphatase family protein [Gemmatimonadales bacterium]|nr:endonuclease/exonuclease/phosphatase family protein [Gemmatimonadales bacterium]